MTELQDYCRRCVEVYGCGRTEALTDPDEISWHGVGFMLVARYLCGCGHFWTCYWSPELLDANGMGG
ncbi:hypothetical protein ACN27E_07545 [Mycobacterium sp. WMMD1722]|uniref:hypothetical protein n=1 Tax=Mycobacterium sp. WMMD1722 TaxID=3404117 RepID=UPI003BF54555